MPSTWEPFLSDDSWITGNAYAIYPPTRHLSHRVRAFIDFLVERFEGYTLLGSLFEIGIQIFDVYLVNVASLIKTE